ISTIVALYLSGSLASMVWPEFVVVVEVVMLALLTLLTLTVEFALSEFELAAVFVSVACWQPEAASEAAMARAAKKTFDSFTRRMEIFSSLRRQRVVHGHKFFGGI